MLHEGADLAASGGQGWGEGVHHAVCAGGELHLPDSPGARRKRHDLIHSPLLQEEPDVWSLLLHDFLADERCWLKVADGGWGDGTGGKKQHHIRDAEGLCREGDYPGPAVHLPGGHSPAPSPHCSKTQCETVSHDSRHISGSREEGDEDAALRGEGSRGVVPMPRAEREVLSRATHRHSGWVSELPDLLPQTWQCVPSSDRGAEDVAAGSLW